MLPAWPKVMAPACSIDARGITGSVTVWDTDRLPGVHWEENPLYHAADRAALPLPSAR